MLALHVDPSSERDLGWRFEHFALNCVPIDGPLAQGPPRCRWPSVVTFWSGACIKCGGAKGLPGAANSILDSSPIPPDSVLTLTGLCSDDCR